jgi:hypothetical protein
MRKKKALRKMREEKRWLPRVTKTAFEWGSKVTAVAVLA